MSQIKPYPFYKYSGSEWLGDVPVSWSVSPLKRAIKKIESGTSVNAADAPAEIGFLGVLKTSCVYEGWFDWRENKTVLEEDLNRVSCPLIKNTLIVSRMNTPDLVGATGLVEVAPEGIFLPDRLWQIYFDNNQEPKFIFYFTKSPAYRAQVKVVCCGTSSSMQNLAQDDFRSLWFAEPPIIEQTQIARFLDHETTRIDTLIEEQQRLIELLKEKRQAVISQAVTKGLDQKVPMKDSGVEWLGEVPQHWQVGALGYFAGIDTGATPDRGNPEYWGGYIPWIKTGEVNYDNIFQAEEHITHEGVKNSAVKIAPKGTLLIAMYGQGVTRGRVAILDIEAAYNQACAGVFVDSRIRVEYLRLFFIAAYPYIRDGGNETSQMNLSSGHVAKIKITVPPINEQISAEHFLNTEIARFDSLINEAGLLANHLQERRSALISAAVTGKIDIRGWKSPASAKVQELEEETM